MKSTMQTTPLLISQLLRYGTTLHADQEVVTWTADGGRRLSYGDLGKKAAQLAHALRGLGITGDQRVATFMWNNAEHLIAYLAIPSMGAVLHALNIRLFPEQLIYTATHAGNQVVIVDNTLAGPFAKLLPHLTTLRHVIVNGPVDAETRAALEAVGAHRERRTTTTSCWPRSPRPSTGPTTSTRTARRRCATPPAPRATPRAWPTRTAATTCTPSPTPRAWASGRATAASSSCRSSTPTRGASPTSPCSPGTSLVMPDRFLQAEPLATMIAAEKVTTGAGVPTIWNDLLRYLDAHAGDASTPATGSWSAARRLRPR